MKANELRTGNWLSKDGEQYQITSATIVGLERGDIDVQPIPLTEEWLVKFGFEFKHTLNQYGWYKSVENRELCWCYSDTISLEFKKGQYDEYNDVLFDVVCNYVHQLQNLYFALTNVEL
jgi:hypothetical protein